MSQIADVVDLEDASGARAAILCGDDFETAAGEIAVRAPAALVAVALQPDEDACERVYERTLFPASRIVGCGSAEQGVVEAAFLVAQAAVLGLKTELTCTVMRDGRFQSLRVVVGPRGVERVLSSPAAA